jgi:nucleoside-diphosphate-sugar epimerase
LWEARRCPDISLAREVLGWEPVVSLSDGLRATAEHLSHNLEVGSSDATD